MVAAIRHAPLFLLPFLGLSSAIPAGNLVATTSLIVPREVPNYGGCEDPTIELVPAVGQKKTQFQPKNHESFRKDVGISDDFYYIARFICVKLKDGCGPKVPAETVQTCWDSYGRASALDPKGTTEQEKWQKRVDTFNRGIKGEDGVSPNPNPGQAGGDYYEIEIWTGPSTVKFISKPETPNMYIDRINNLFSLKTNGDFETKNDQKFAGGCTISTTGYADKSGKGDALTKAMKKTLFNMLEGDLIVRHGSERTRERCNGFQDSAGQCCRYQEKDPKTGKYRCVDGWVVRDDKYVIFPNEVSMRATITPNNKRGNGYMKWNIDCGKSGLSKNVWKKDCDWCAKVKLNIGHSKLDPYTHFFKQSVGGMGSTMMLDCDTTTCKK